MLVPQLDGAIPRACNDLASFMWQPSVADDWFPMSSTDPFEQLCRFPIPEYKVSFRIARTEKLAVRRKGRLTGETCNIVTLEGLFSVGFEAVCCKSEDLVIHALTSEPLSIR